MIGKIDAICLLKLIRRVLVCPCPGGGKRLPRSDRPALRAGEAERKRPGGRAFDEERQASMLAIFLSTPIAR